MSRTPANSWPNIGPRIFDRHIQLPEEARQVIEQQMEAEGMPNPFERGPEITEIR